MSGKRTVTNHFLCVCASPGTVQMLSWLCAVAPDLSGQPEELHIQTDHKVLRSYGTFEKLNFILHVEWQSGKTRFFIIILTIVS